MSKCPKSKNETGQHMKSVALDIRVLERKDKLPLAFQVDQGGEYCAETNKGQWMNMNFQMQVCLRWIIGLTVKWSVTRHFWRGRHALMFSVQQHQICHDVLAFRR